MIFSPQFVRGVITNIFPGLRKTQKVNLGLAVYGQILSQSTILSQIVREVPGAFKHKHRLKRLWRFVSNPLVKPEVVGVLGFLVHSQIYLRQIRHHRPGLDRTAG